MLHEYAYLINITELLYPDHACYSGVYIFLPFGLKFVGETEDFSWFLSQQGIINYLHEFILRREGGFFLGKYMPLLLLLTYSPPVLLGRDELLRRKKNTV